jgi:DNA-binding protein
MAEEQKTSEAPKERDNIIYIGEKPFMNYVTGVVTQFKTKNETEVIIKARGKFISRAVDVAEASVKRFLKEENLKIKDIKVNSEEFENKEGKKVNVSTIDIVIVKQV